MNNLNRNNTHLLSPLRVHSTSTYSIQMKHHSTPRRTPSVVLSPLNLSSVNSFYIPRSINTNIFNNSLRIRLSPIKHTILKKYNITTTNYPHRSRVYPSINKCNSKRCGCCNFLSHRSTITSNVNGRTFNVILNTDID
jgi:hypothetical protein